MITTLDTQPQEWMESNPNAFHTIAACTFDNIEHIEYWINKLVPKNRNGEFVKWSSGKRNVRYRDIFINNCIKYVNEIDFYVNCISAKAGEMSWIAWSFYMQNQNHIRQEKDRKGRNNLVFQITEEKSIAFPVLRAGFLIWYYYALKYLSDVKKIKGKFLSDYFASDELGPGEGKALGAAFVNFLLKQSNLDIQISLPTNERFKNLDRISDYFCGWVNSIRNLSATKENIEKFDLLSNKNPMIDGFIYIPLLTIIDENGTDITSEIMRKVIEGSKINGENEQN
jgi:hypothetical protein